MNKYAAYLKELKHFEMYEDADGFVTYGFMRESDGSISCHIEDIYVVPEKRKAGVASQYADVVSAIAREAGASKLLGSIVPSLPGSNYRMQVLLAYGFKLRSSEADFIWFEKELKDE